MKFLLSVCVLATAYTSLFAQFDPPGLTKTSKAYHAYRMVETAPSFGLAKVEALIKKLKADSQDDQAMTVKQFNGLSISERFTYCLVHGEVFSQNCDGMPATLGEENMIFGHPLGPWGEQQQWSDKQKAFLHSNRATVISLLRATMRSKNRVGTNLKMAIIELDAYELIPDMVYVFSPTKKDNDILSTFFLLMRDGKFKPFLASATYTKLYAGGEASYRAFVVGNPENKQLTISRAMAYYKSRKG
jgi:hypothetical protein